MSLSKSPAEITEQVGTGVNYATTTAINETGKCAVANGYSLLFNSGLTTTKNSDPTNALNDAPNRAYLRRRRICKRRQHSDGAWPAFPIRTSPIETGRQAALGLATETDFHSFTLDYTRQINPNLSVSGVIGLVGVTNGFSLGLPKTLLPIYTLSANWSLTPKLALIASASRTISPPTTVIANAEQSYNASLGLTYQLTPKVVAQRHRFDWVFHLVIHCDGGADGDFAFFL